MGWLSESDECLEGGAQGCQHCLKTWSRRGTDENLLCNHSGNAVETHLQHIHPRSIRQSDEMMARAVEQIPTLAGIKIEEDAGDDNDLLLETSGEEVQPVVDTLGQITEIKPKVEGGVWRVRELEAHLRQATEDVVSLFAEVVLQGFHLAADLVRFEHRDSGLLEGDVGTTVQVGTAGADGLDEFLGAQDPCYTPARETETLGQTVNDQNVWKIVRAC